MTKFENKLLKDLLFMKEKELKETIENNQELPVSKDKVEELIDMISTVRFRIAFLEDYAE